MSDQQSRLNDQIHARLREPVDPEREKTDAVAKETAQLLDHACTLVLEADERLRAVSGAYLTPTWLTRIYRDLREKREHLRSIPLHLPGTPPLKFIGMRWEPLKPIEGEGDARSLIAPEEHLIRARTALGILMDEGCVCLGKECTPDNRCGFCRLREVLLG